MGEDILDPYGGSFKAARGLSSAFPERVWTTPISEAGVVGLAAGMALRGLRPVVEIMFGDFLTLTADQLINHAAKFRWMYHDQVSLPMVVRTPMGGRRGYGPTHSQTLEKHFLGVPGLRVLAASNFDDPGELLFRAITQPEGPGCWPVLFVENKLLYLKNLENKDTLNEYELEIHTESRLSDPEAQASFPTPTYVLKLKSAPAAALTIAAYGYMAELARQAIYRLAYEQEIFAELVLPTQLSPFDLSTVIDSVRRTGRLLTVEENTASLGWGAEVLSQALETPGLGVKAAGRVAAADLPIPASGPLEAAVLPGIEQIIQAAVKICRPGAPCE